MLKTVAYSLGLAALLLLENYVDLLGGASNARTHVPFSLAGICLANLLDIGLLALSLFVMSVLLRRTRFWSIARLLLVILLPLYFLSREQALLPFQLPQAPLDAVYILWPGAILAIFLRRPTFFRRITRLAGVFGIAAGIFAAASILQMLWLLHWKPGPQSHTATWASSPHPLRQHPRIIWIVFDELSYDQVFEHRAEGLSLPNFDLFRSVSTLYSGAQPIGARTAKILPSLLAGRLVDDLRFSMSDRLDLHYSGVRGWHPVDPASSLFGDAQRVGWRTAAVGWYNPYCTAYQGAIDSCYWSNFDRLEGPMAQNKTVLQNAGTALLELGRRAVTPAQAARDICTYDVRTRLETHLDLERHALDLLRNDQADFVLLHLPTPHSPNIWNRVRANYTQSCGSSYLDNLALADRELGNVLTLLTASARWPQTSVVVQGDHSWRIDLWKGLPAWTGEDAKASSAGFDPRPALLIHSPGQSTPATNSAPWSILNIHDTIQHLLQSA